MRERFVVDAQDPARAVEDLARQAEGAFDRVGTLDAYTVATLPSTALPARLIFVVDESGGAVPAFNDGAAWRRLTDRAIVS